MAENPESINSPQRQQTSQKPIETVVNSLIKNQSKQKPLTHLKDGKSYDALFKDIKSVLSDFDMSIEGCKKYNEAKIHRKYEIRIADLEEQVKILRDRLKQEQNARSPSKKYIQDLVGQLVIYKFENEKLKSEIQRLSQNKDMSEQNSTPQINTQPIRVPTERIQKQAYMERQKSITSLTSVQPNRHYQFNFRQQVIDFLGKQHNIRKVKEQPKSRFEHFLKKRLDIINQWSFVQFLTQINKWYLQYYNAAEEKISSQLRSNILSTLEDDPSYTKLPPISTPAIIPKSIPMLIGGSGTELRKIVKKRQVYKNKHNYSTMEVISGSRQKFQKFTLK